MGCIGVGCGSPDDSAEASSVNARNTPSASCSQLRSLSNPGSHLFCRIPNREDGAERLVELGDGQVSDLVGWTAKAFAKLWLDEELRA